MNTRLSVIVPGLVVIVVLLVSCATISPFSPKAYEYATTLKVETLALMDLATQPYEDYRTDIHLLLMKIDQAYEYANGLPKNEISARQWEILKDPDRDLLGGFFKYWEEKSTVPKVYIDEMKEQVVEAFDTIIGLESRKIKQKDLQ